MANPRDEILDWFEQGRIAPGRLRAALEAGGALPGASDWRRFLDRLLLWMGSVMLACSAIFFFAFNWAELGRLARIGLVEAPIVGALFLLWRLGLERASGKAVLFAAALLAGGLLALIGQTYQTGADTWELFAAWAAAIFPWTLVGRLAPLWVLWLVLLNLAVSLYYLTFGFLWMVFAPERLMWMLFGLNTVALVIWEACAAAGLQWLRERWSVRVVATASGVLITWLALMDLFSWRSSSHWGLPLWLAWMAAAYAAYRHWLKDVYVLAGGVLSAIVVIASFLVKNMADRGEAGAFLFIGMTIIGLSAGGGWWLRSVINEHDREEA